MTDPRDVLQDADDAEAEAKRVQREAIKALRAARRAKGCCPDCGKPSPGYYYCIACRDKRAKRMQRLRKSA